jgi:hypothetical protein
MTTTFIIIVALEYWWWHLVGNVISDVVKDYRQWKVMR